MSTMQNTDAIASIPPAAKSVSTQDPLPASLVLLLASGAGLSVAAIYYSQPILGVLGPSLGASVRMIGLVPTLTQLGYALGLLLLAPLGDRFDRRKIILVKLVALLLALLMAASAPSIGVLLAASLLVGVSATLAQDIIPAAATLAPDASRGRTVGTVMTGLLLGILLSRVLSGFVAEHFGWRAMFYVAAVSIALIGGAVYLSLPSFKAGTTMRYGALLASLGHLWSRHALLRRAAISQALLSVGFSAFWSTLAVMLHAAPFNFGTAAAGAFGLAGAAGALAAPIAGRLADKRGPEFVARLGVGVALASFVAMGFATLLSPTAQLAVLIVTTIGFDLGVQATLIANQTIVYSIDPPARSRLNAVLMTSVFIGMATGAGLGSLIIAQWGWVGVTALAASATTLALLLRMRSGKVGNVSR